ncbi:MAG TPA: DUF2116 family Zn-ribbon domain-containing protein [Candidatus Thermoplasmatota archaeon]|nr:DUF2116 family Zn-ribbon domain-containing protein [Candidatus Thermoplasmatota archaeon]
MVQIPNHGHCQICGRAVAFGDRVCGPECKANFDVQAKKRKNLMLMIYGAMALSIVLLLLNTFAGVR